MTSPAGDRPVLIVGAPRSGTTLLSLMVHAHPRLAMPPENRFVLKVWEQRHSFGDLTTERGRLAVLDVITAKGNMLRDLRLEQDDVRAAVLSAPPTIGSILAAVLSLYADKHGKARWGDKRPVYFREVDALLRMFPDAQVVHVIRDGRANVASLERMPWWPYPLTFSMASWAMAEHCLRRDRARLPADTLHVVRYETLVADPEPVLRNLCDFLGEDFDPAMLEPKRVRRTQPKRKRRGWHEGLKRPVGAAVGPAWRDELDRADLALVEAGLRRSLVRNGYVLSGEGGRPNPLRLLRFWASYGRLRLAAQRRWALEARDERRSGLDVAVRPR